MCSESTLHYFLCNGEIEKGKGKCYTHREQLVRKKKDGVVVFELDPNASKKIRPIPIDYSCLSDPELIHLAETGTDPREWQTEIMDQNDERSGLASGNAG